MYRKGDGMTGSMLTGLCLTGLLLAAMCMPVSVLQAEAIETADTLLDLERKIEIQKRTMELRELQIKRQEQDMRFFKGSMGGGGNAGSGPVVVRVPEIRLDMIRTFKHKMVAGLHYGERYQVVRKGDVIDQGVKVLKVTNLGVVIDVHGSKMHFGLNHTAAKPSPDQHTEGAK